MTIQADEELLRLVDTARRRFGRIRVWIHHGSFELPLIVPAHPDYRPPPPGRYELAHTTNTGRHRT